MLVAHHRTDVRSVDRHPMLDTQHPSVERSIDAPPSAVDR
jgi:hypothetical protein